MTFGNWAKAHRYLPGDRPTAFDGMLLYKMPPRISRWRSSSHIVRGSSADTEDIGMVASTRGLPPRWPEKTIWPATGMSVVVTRQHVEALPYFRWVIIHPR